MVGYIKMTNSQKVRCVFGYHILHAKIATHEIYPVITTVGSYASTSKKKCSNFIRIRCTGCGKALFRSALCRDRRALQEIVVFINRPGTLLKEASIPFFIYPGYKLIK